MEQMFQEIIKWEKEILEFTLQYFNSHVLYTWQWWLLLVLTIVPWIIWWKLVDKKRLVEISIFGFFILVWVLLSDLFGVAYGLWNYPIELLPAPGFSVTADITVFTTNHMLLYQYFPKWKGFTISNVIYALIFAFVMEPIAVWNNFYIMLNWEHIYSVPIYTAKALIGKLFVEWIFRVAKRENLVK